MKKSLYKRIVFVIFTGVFVLCLTACSRQSMNVVPIEQTARLYAEVPADWKEDYIDVTPDLGYAIVPGNDGYLFFRTDGYTDRDICSVYQISADAQHCTYLKSLTEFPDLWVHSAFKMQDGTYLVFFTLPYENSKELAYGICFDEALNMLWSTDLRGMSIEKCFTASDHIYLLSRSYSDQELQDDLMELSQDGSVQTVYTAHPGDELLTAASEEDQIYFVERTIDYTVREQHVMLRKVNEDFEPLWSVELPYSRQSSIWSILVQEQTVCVVGENAICIVSTQDGTIIRQEDFSALFKQYSDEWYSPFDIPTASQAEMPSVFLHCASTSKQPWFVLHLGDETKNAEIVWLEPTQYTDNSDVDLHFYVYGEADAETARVFAVDRNAHEYLDVYNWNLMK